MFKLKLFFCALLVLLLLAALSLWLYNKMHSGRFAPDVTVAPKGVELPFVPPTAPIEFRTRWSIDGGNTGFGIGCLLFAIWLFTRDVAWLRLLAWPVAAGALLFAGMSFHAAWNELGTVYRADATGLRIEDRSKTRSIPWSSLSVVRLRRIYGPIGSSPTHQTMTVRYRELEFVDARGDRVLLLDLPLKPTDAGELLEKSLPVWTQRPLEVVPVNR